ncbi:M15 family metallopeptidase [Pontibacter sp. JAM-7]|uniref:M15 family metallopeptidase n=1 Tax=Pontibacter sp. JAM-7 TaxID=3366581 RepID=UPI003AF6E156
MHSFKFSKRSIDNLKGVHPELVLVASRALMYSSIDFAITDGVRTEEEQKQLVAQGKSRTLNSKHLTGDAIDVMAYVDGKGNWTWDLYVDISESFKKAADELGIKIRWGGDWKTFKDGPHFERAI